MATEITGKITGWQTVNGNIDIKTIRGFSAYDIAVQYGGFVGTEEEWLASLKGDQGDQGIQGPTGPTGPTGERGNGISNIAMDSGGYISIITNDGIDYRFYIKGDKGDVGDKGNTGTGISSVVLNNDYTLTITFTDGNTYTTSSIRGAKGDKGDKGDTGEVPDIATVGITGDYDDLINKPTLPTEEDYVEVLNLMTDFGYASPYSDINGNVITEGDDYIVLG